MKLNALATVTSLAVAALLTPTRAEPVDMSTITCAQLAEMPEDGVGFMLTWLQGYVAGTGEQLSMDPDELGKSVDATIAYCRENLEMSVLNATKESSK